MNTPNNPFSRTTNAPRKNTRTNFSFGKLLMIAVILLVIYLIYKYYKSNQKDKTLVKSHNAKQMKMIGPETSSGAQMLQSYPNKSWKYVCLTRGCKLIMDFNI